MTVDVYIPAADTGSERYRLHDGEYIYQAPALTRAELDAALSRWDAMDEDARAAWRAQRRFEIARARTFELYDEDLRRLAE